MNEFPAKSPPLDPSRWQSPYDGVAGLLNADLSLAQRSTLLQLDQALHGIWGLGANVVLSWCATEHGVDLLVVPHYAVAELTAADLDPTEDTPSVSAEFMQALITGRRQVSAEQMRKIARLLRIEPMPVRLKSRIADGSKETELVEQMVKRYGISYVPRRAVAVFDIVGFSLLSPFEQMTQLNSLSYSINSAHSKMLSRRSALNFARSCTGDGFYIWNRDNDVGADASLYHFMHIVLADNAIARRKARVNSVPLLRACFHVGSCYEFHQAEGLNPSLYDYIVGDVTIELARMIERALPGQILVGEFGGENAQGASAPDSLEFVRLAQHRLSDLSGLELSGERIESIKCYLTGERRADGDYSVRRLTIADKHGLKRNVFNAKVNIYRQRAEPILLGIEDKVLAASPLNAASSHLLAAGEEGRGEELRV